MNGKGVVKLIDHVIASTTQSMVELAMVRGAIGKHDTFFHNQQGKIMEVKGLKKIVTNYKGNFDEKDREINDLKASINSLRRMVSEWDEDIIHKGYDIV